MLVAYSTGARPNELMTMTWGDVRVNPQDSKENQQVMRLLKVRSENSKNRKIQNDQRTSCASFATTAKGIRRDWYAMRTNRFPV